MKVKELIEQLSQCNPNAEIEVWHEKMPESFKPVSAERHNPNIVEIFVK